MRIVHRALDTSRLTLEPLREDHAPLVFGGLADPRVWRFIEDDPPASVAALRARYRRLVAGCPRDGETWINWIARLRDGGEAIGLVELTLRREARVCDLAYLFVPRFWRRGLAKEACARALDEVREQGWADAVRASMDPRNVASMRLAEALGLSRTGVDRGASVIDGVAIDEQRYELRWADGRTAPTDDATDGPDGLRLRAPSAADAETLRALRRHAGWDEEHVERWLIEARDGAKVLWLAEDATKQPAGMVALDLVDADPEVANGSTIGAVSGLVVAPSFARRGIGRWLTRVAEGEARRRGLAWITLNTRPTNAAALSLYGSMGYEWFKDHARSWGLAAHLRKRLR